MEGSYTCDQLIELVSRDFPTPPTYKLGLSLYVIVTFEEYIQILGYMYDIVHLFLSRFSVHMQLCNYLSFLCFTSILILSFSKNICDLTSYGRKKSVKNLFISWPLQKEAFLTKVRNSQGLCV